ncbi:hypothetical protein [Sphingobium sp. Ant17]|uniref:hypothetical protein n=1 Tax=Sphingobium sp. Ant17 TaxID=1461752 RepID=UPI0013775B9B|nr:hypothetical protein [Sphingobium sp. Ant17]
MPLRADRISEQEEAEDDEAEENAGGNIGKPQFPPVRTTKATARADRTPLKLTATGHIRTPPSRQISQCQLLGHGYS